MGSAQLTPNIKYVRIINDDNFGSVEIFEPLQNPTEYIMKYKRQAVSKEELEHAHRLQVNLSKLKHRILSKYYFVEATVQRECIEGYHLNCYYSFYNITLHQIFKKRLNCESCFPQAQLWYILQSLLQLGEYLKDQGYGIEDFNMKKVFVTPGGFVKMYLTEIQQNHRHSNYYRTINWSQSSGLLLSPQQLKLLKLKEYEILYDVQKSDIFSIGVMLLQLMSLCEGTYYNYDQHLIDMDKINYSLGQLQYSYSFQLVQFVKELLVFEPENRHTFSQAKNRLQQLKNKEVIQMKKCIGSDISVKRKSQIITYLTDSNFNEKLVAAPIKSVNCKKRSTIITKSGVSNKQN